MRAVWAYHRFALSTADVEDLLAERGVIVSREAIRLWVNRFGQHFANCIRGIVHVCRLALNCKIAAVVAWLGSGQKLGVFG